MPTILEQALSEISNVVSSLFTFSSASAIIEELLKQTSKADFFMTPPLEIYIEMGEGEGQKVAVGEATEEARVDTDGDNVPDEQDAFPFDPTEWADVDNDGIGDNADPEVIVPEVDTTIGGDDSDGDGVVDAEDAFPQDPNEWQDLDKDGIGDNADPEVTAAPAEGSGQDSDGDGVPDDQDAFPDDPFESEDADGDGIGDNADPEITAPEGTEGTGTGEEAPDRDGDGVPDEEDAFPDDPDKADCVDENQNGICDGDEQESLNEPPPDVTIEESTGLLQPNILRFPTSRREPYRPTLLGGIGNRGMVNEVRIGLGA